MHDTMDDQSRLYSCNIHRVQQFFFRVDVFEIQYRLNEISNERLVPSINHVEVECDNELVEYDHQKWIESLGSSIVDEFDLSPDSQPTNLQSSSAFDHNSYRYDPSRHKIQTDVDDTVSSDASNQSIVIGKAMSRENVKEQELCSDSLGNQCDFYHPIGIHTPQLNDALSSDNPHRIVGVDQYSFYDSFLNDIDGVFSRAPLERYPMDRFIFQSTHLFICSLNRSCSCI
jgi:hypothetical protein